MASLTAELVLLFIAPAASAGMFLGLGTAPSSSVGSFATGVSADGSTVVGSINTGGGSEPFRWTFKAGMDRLGHLAGSNGGVAYGVSGDGSLVVGYGGGRAFEWRQADGIVALPNTSSYAYSAALAVSADGSAIVGYATTSAFGPAGILGAGMASGVSGDGSIIVGLTPADNFFRWTQSTGMVTLGTGDANAISEDGSTIVGSEPITFHTSMAFRWTATSGVVGLGTLPGDDHSEAYAVSGDGSVIVGRSFLGSGIGLHAIIWDATHGMRDLENVLIGDGLDLAGWQLTDATGVSADGLTIVGNGIDPSGEREAWVARLDAPVPEPSTLVIWLCGASAAIACKLKRCLSPRLGAAG